MNLNKVNKIEAQIDQSDYEQDGEYLNIKIDGEWLDRLFDHWAPEHNIKGTIPTLSYGMAKNEEEQEVWDRILPEEDSIRIAPILMCPDDLDFSCILVVVEAKRENGMIYWNKIGLDRTESTNAKHVGRQVEWIDEIPGFVFYEDDYEEVLNAFKNQYWVDHDQYVKRSQDYQETYELESLYIKDKFPFERE